MCPELNRQVRDEHSGVFETITLDLALFSVFCVDLLVSYRLGILLNSFGYDDKYMFRHTALYRYKITFTAWFRET